MTRIDHTEQKQLIRAVAALVSLEGRRRTTKLNEVELREIEEARNLLDGRSGRRVVNAVIDWVQSGYTR